MVVEEMHVCLVEGDAVAKKYPHDVKRNPVGGAFSARRTSLARGKATLTK